MAEIVLKVNDVSKYYNISNSGSISRDLSNWMSSKKQARPNGKLWALQNIDFELRKGDRLAVTGDNGAGKSTLLKILSRITTPSSGTIHGKGKITSMLEVGIGFHPELSGIENIYLNGAMLGMTKRDIKSKVEEIVDFAQVTNQINNPVKRYSSGMYMRLAFATAAHLQSDTMIMDEVLAVGDQNFKKKCIRKLNDLSKDFGKTIILVSHDKENLSSLCNKEIKLIKGMME
ncbi:ABC transporter ATP-binding protein [Pedobacter sp. JCM 36344]|uniref:ABC transporter ATP-binding protein n=1 Tax=Pedobacter sp. JCM 36344 TaxID=3374280 RepID=UPI00397CBD62